MNVELGAQWYADSLTWAIIAAAAGWIGIAILGWITWRAAHPKRRILYTLVANDPPSEHPGLRHLPALDALDDPRVLQIVISLFGRKDIGTEDFDRLGKSKRQPLRIDVGVPIIQILKITKLHDARPRWPEPRVDGTSVAIGPGIIDHASSILISVLVDGSNPTLTCPSHPFRDIKVQQPKDLPDTREIYANVMVFRGWP